MKILQINKFFFENGGSERYFFDVSDALAERGHQVIHFSMQDDRNKPSRYSDYFVDHIDFQSSKTISKAAHYLYSTEAARKLERLVHDTAPDVAHLHNIAHQLTPSIITTLKKAHIPVVQTVHDYQLICPNYKLFTQDAPCERCNAHRYWNAVRYSCVQENKASSALAALELGLHNVLLQTYKRGVARFIAPSRFLHEKLLAWGWNERQMMYLPHFVDITPVQGARKKKQFLFVGRLTKEKGADVLFAAAAQMPDATFLFVGAGEMQSALEQQSAGLQNCTLLGAKDRQTVYRLMQESLAVIVPSIWYENAPLVIYEALALGTPVIASRLGGNSELIQEGENGYLFSPGDATDLLANVRKILHNPLHVESRQSSKQKHLDALEALYEEVLPFHKIRKP